MNFHKDILEQLQSSIVQRDQDGRHVYTYESKDYFGVSSILDVIAQTWKMDYYKKNTAKAIEKRLIETADIGKRIHALIEADCRGHDVAPQPDCIAAFENWKAFKVEHKIEPMANEVMVVNPALGYGGTVDSICMYEGKPMVADYKTGSVGITYGYQLAAYRQALIELGVIDESFGMAVFQIHRDGHVAQPFVYEHYDFCFQRFLDALGIFRGLNFKKLNNWYGEGKPWNFLTLETRQLGK